MNSDKYGNIVDLAKNKKKEVSNSYIDQIDF